MRAPMMARALETINEVGYSGVFSEFKKKAITYYGIHDLARVELWDGVDVQDIKQFASTDHRKRISQGTL